jgi:hypothetical protein
VTDIATHAATAQDRNNAALPPEMFRHWIHSREEDQDDVQFFRPADFAFPPSFGRDGLELHPDGQFVQHDIGPADGTVEIPGRWTQENAVRIAVRFDGAREDYDFTVESVEASLLRIRPEPAASTRTGRGWVPARRNRIRAFRRDRYVLIVAEGDLPTPGHDVDIKQSPERIFPPRFALLRWERPGVWPDVVAPFRHSELIVFPADQPTVTVDHADGRDEVEIAACGQELAGFASVVPVGGDGAGVAEAIGMSADLSFDEAFAKAVENLPPSAPPHPDALTTVTVDDIRGLFGGIAGFHHLVVRVRSSTG